ncbi:MAG: ATP-dependent DNA helicase RecG [Oscillospiraceae bacterium]|nr:ATP-dependent DNA helicase RecG [Oscillospiraceae bacterium]
MNCEDQVQFLKRVGPVLAKKFARLGIVTVGDLLAHYPRRYVDYAHPVPVLSAPAGEEVVVKATVYAKLGTTRLPGGRTLVKVQAGDDSASLTLTWFNIPYAADKLLVDETYWFAGRVGGPLTAREMVSPVVRTCAQVKAAPFSAVYPQTEGLSSAVIGRCVAQALEQCVPLPDPLPPELRRRFRLPDKWTAVRMIHRPAGPEEIAAARRRLIFEELLCLQLALTLSRSRGQQRTSAPMEPRPLEPFWASLPFAPTGAQRRAAEEIAADLCRPAPMNRLLQGDVGSGKTLVAAAGIYLAALNGWQSALMAPTEILAVQHAENLQKTLAPFGLRVALLTGSMKAAAKKAALAAIASGEADLVVGTHAVLGTGVEFARLGLAIVDEQHRFGVRQRGQLAGKAGAPHLLVMSATPIPRTLSLLVYGDLDVSILDELPPGRMPIKTYAITGKKRRDMFAYLDKCIAAGQQVYIVCPLIEEGENTAQGMQAAKTYLEQVAKPLLPGRRIGLMHGRLKPKEKAEVMAAFSAGELDVLVSTTVIEVGVDVPRAGVMVIENAERYGLSALHQLRGRVGRGGGQAVCILISDHEGEAVRDRLRFLCHTTDGFQVAQYDLDHRGPGDFFGSRQHGLPTLQIADLASDTRALYAAQQTAHELLEADPGLDKPEHQVLARQVEQLLRRAALN